ncbi:hypothetical protein SK355_02300 [Candidatus Fukatsuia symbiotica]|uniref:Single-stranded DNA-binding protein n=1 Tax=Candidatus Fukatsuia symbiotica TaxID=1878942 RepID=A0A2U8I530_9GAMM|nr:hypothetical protein [Candidatus Fukatsuia symbiotica]AWK13295.1 hypothetical protein CCS41_00375 [Candidatus Fukatsuia symbiotica]MEA9444169.1 hypothetical protein [Candidatus Fukatsuia symbiotica]
MAHTITLKLQQAAREFAATDAIGFALRGGVKYYDRKLKTHAFTNYQAVLFAKAGNQADFYRERLNPGAIVELFGESIKIDTYEGKNGQAIVLELNNARLGFIEAGGTQPQGQQRQQNQQLWGQASMKAVSQQQCNPTPPIAFDEPIPF